jgi:hypothetical protein
MRPHAYTSKHYREPIRTPSEDTRIDLRLQPFSLQRFLCLRQAVIKPQKFLPRARQKWESRVDDQVCNTADRIVRTSFMFASMGGFVWESGSLEVVCGSSSCADKGEWD